MDDLITKILDIEDRAQEIIADAKKADAELDGRVDEQTKYMETDITRRAEVKNAFLKQREEDEAAEKIARINSETEKNLAALQKKYEENKEKWAEKIVSEITGI